MPRQRRSTLYNATISSEPWPPSSSGLPPPASAWCPAWPPSCSAPHQRRDSYREGKSSSTAAPEALAVGGQPERDYNKRGAGPFPWLIGSLQRD